MCLKWDFFGIEENCATICKQLQIRIISENIFSLILLIFRYRKLGSPERSFSGHRASPFHFYIRQRRSQNRNELYKRNRPYFVLAALPQKPIMADTERGLENRVLPNPRFCFE